MRSLLRLLTPLGLNELGLDTALFLEFKLDGSTGDSFDRYRLGPFLLFFDRRRLLPLSLLLLFLLVPFSRLLLLLVLGLLSSLLLRELLHSGLYAGIFECCDLKLPGICSLVHGRET